MLQGGTVSRSGKSIYRFGDIEVDSSRACVRKGGKEQYIRQQSFHLLLYLLEERERVVPKEELIEHFWGSTAVTDNALTQCIADIRKVLGDDSRHPRFVKTIPKAGYGFIGTVEVEQLEVHSEAHAQPRGPELAPKSWRRLAAMVAVLAALTGILVTILIARSREQRLEITLPPIPGKKTVAVMYFENQSRRADLNWLREGLADMFITAMARSDRVTVLSRYQLQLLLQRIDHQPGSEIHLDEALEIARRSHAETIVLGSFAPLGDGFLVNVQVHEAVRGRLLTADRFTTSRPAEILGQIDVLSLKLTSELGVAPSQGTTRASLTELMTKDFEAYRYYSLGVSRAQNFENSEAIALLQKAIQRDPQFAMAYARIGYAYSVTDFMPEKGRPYLEKAFQLSDRLTEKDRLYVASWYAIAREDYSTAIRTLREILAQYPTEIEAYARLARLLYREEQAQEAISVLQAGLAADPDEADLYNVLGICFLGLKRYEDAIASHERYVELSPKEPNAHDSLGMSYQQSGRYPEALAEYRAALLLNPKFEPAIIHLGDLYSQQGRYEEAVRQYSRYIEVTQSDTARGVAYGSIAQVYRKKRDLRLAEEAARNELRWAPGAVWDSLLFAVDRGDKAKASVLKERLFENRPYPERGVRQELRSHDYYLGMLALKEGRSAEALARFKDALHHFPPSSGLDLYEDCLANGYLQSGQTEAAIEEYERILHLNPNYPLLQYHLAQAYERKSERDRARTEYTRFLQIWKDADEDIPEVMDARKRVTEVDAHARPRTNRRGHGVGVFTS
ncbi:MAG: tetratricopeptide repeat protein [Acidobacteriaceae bacterium]|nr:tetratricopeptide repeat protein [Acidobacteriaceae bacterium]MBV9296221.1 tetratricopeptide repeat protein [Acidobacteriaceae bacterium]